MTLTRDYLVREYKNLNDSGITNYAYDLGHGFTLAVRDYNSLEFSSVLLFDFKLLTFKIIGLPTHVAYRDPHRMNDYIRYTKAWLDKRLPDDVDAVRMMIAMGALD